MNTYRLHRLPKPGWTTLGLALAFTLAGCQTQPKAPDANAKPELVATEGGVRMPAGADLTRIRLAERGEKTKVYTQVRGMGDPSNEKLLFPAAVAREIGVTPVQVQRRFLDTIAKTRRFETFDSSTSVTAEATDYVVDAMFTGTTQELRRIEGGVRVSVTRVRLSARVIARYQDADNPRASTPETAFEMEVVGETGGSTGDRVTLLASENENGAAVQKRLGIDYERAMQRAFDELSRRVDLALRPMGKVLGVNGDSISVVGGLRNGLQGGDELVIFRARTARIGKRDELINTIPVVAVRCDGVGSATSQCEVVRRDARYKPQVGDFAILTDHSATKTRLEL